MSLVLRICSPLIALSVAAITLTCGGDDPVEPPQPPRISAFTASPTDILPGDSSLLSYTVQRAKTVTLQPGNQTLPDVASGSVWVKPPIPTAYTLVAANDGGLDSSSLIVTMSAAVPSFGAFSLSADTLLIGESTTMTWQTVRTDSIVVDNGIGKLSNPSAGQLILSPSVTTLYTAVAFNAIGNDTATVRAIVQDPQAVVPVGGLYYTGLMGQSTQTPNMAFRVVDKVGLNISKLWIQFRLIQGDGLLSADSLLPANNGQAMLSYTFSGALGHAVIRAVVPGVDSVDVFVRANTLIPGAGGQGQFALFSEQWGMVKNFNGSPVADVPDPSFFIQYQDYEAQLGVVVMIFDANQNELAEDNEPVLGVIVNTVYQHKTPDSIGIGSHYNDIFAVYGTPENIIVDTANPPPGEPPGIAYLYNTKGLTFWTNPSDSTTFEIHLVDTSVAPLSGFTGAKNAVATESDSYSRESRYPIVVSTLRRQPLTAP